MASCDENSVENLGNSSLDYKNSEIAASNALRQIQALYDEIMCPVKDESIYFSDEENSSPILTNGHKSETSFVCKQCALKRNKVCKYCHEQIRCDSCYNFVSVHSGKYLTHKKHSPLSNRNCHSNLPPRLKTGNLQEHYNTNENSAFRITVPQPFSQSIRNEQWQELQKTKLNKLKEDLNEMVEKELRIKIRSNPVPKHVHEPLYQNLVQENEKKRKERKEKVQEKFKTLVKPFQLSTTKPRLVKAKSSPDLTHVESDLMFKAKPVPKNILSSKVSEKLKQKEKIRKILIADRAEEKLKESSLPFSVKRVNRSLSLMNLKSIEDKKHQGGKRETHSGKNLHPNSDRLVSKNIFNNKSKEAMENWNAKVLQMSYPKVACSNKPNRNEELNNCINKSKNKLISQSLRFANLPVRMSAAAMLREKQIRTELFARKWKEEQEKLEYEMKLQKEKETKKNIWPKLHRLDPTLDSNKIIEETIKRYRSSQSSREQEYATELQEIMERVGKQLLLIERQTKEINDEIIKKRDSHFSEDSKSSNTSHKEDSEDETSQSQNTEKESSSISSSASAS